MNILKVNVTGFNVMQLKVAGYALSSAKCKRCALEERELLFGLLCTLSNTASDYGTGFTLKLIQL